MAVDQRRAACLQRVSHRTAVPVDFKVVQRAVNADGVGNLLSGLAGTVPNTTYASSISIADLTGVAARRVALYAGIIIVLTAFVPKIAALLQVVPDPLAGAYILIFLVLLFRQGVRLGTTRSARSHRRDGASREHPRTQRRS